MKAGGLVEGQKKQIRVVRSLEVVTVANWPESYGDMSLEDTIQYEVDLPLSEYSDVIQFSDEVRVSKVEVIVEDREAVGDEGES